MWPKCTTLFPMVRGWQVFMRTGNFSGLWAPHFPDWRGVYRSENLPGIWCTPPPPPPPPGICFLATSRSSSWKFAALSSSITLVNLLKGYGLYSPWCVELALEFLKVPVGSRFHSRMVLLKKEWRSLVVELHWQMLFSMHFLPALHFGNDNWSVKMLW